MKTLSMLDLRQQSREVIDGLRHGEHYQLTYRGKVVGKLSPDGGATQIQSDDPIYRLAEISESGSTPTPLTNEEADRLIYGY